MIVERLIRHFRANEYSDSCKRKIDTFYIDLFVLYFKDLKGNTSYLLQETLSAMAGF